MREMKDSGIEWIGKIPANWNCIKGKYLFTNDKYIPGVNSYKYDRLSLTLNGVISRPKDDANGLQPNDFNTYQLLRENELVFKLIDLQNISTSRVGLAHSTGLVSPAYIILHNNENIIPEFAEKFYLMMWYRQIFNALGDSGVRSNLNVSELLDIKVTLPSFQEQQLIARFLDEKCGEIDLLISDIQKQIETLQEYKKSVITEAITKGLDPNVEMKDSGIEWAGEVPNHWCVSKLGNIITLSDERNYEPLEEVNLISLYTDRGVVQHTDLKSTTGNKAQNADGYKIVHKDNIVVNIILAWMGAMGISKYDGVTSPAYDVYKINKKKVNAHFCHYVLRTPAIAGECKKYGRGIMMMRWRTYSTEFKKIKIMLPPLQEQQLIANFLDEKCNEIDEIIKTKNKQLETLEQYKKSLIYEYVTGKKEVLE